MISCGRGNRFGHPSPAVLARYRAIGAAIYRTDEQGAITIETDGQTDRGHSIRARGARRARRYPPLTLRRQQSDDGSPRPSTAASGCLAHPASDGRHHANCGACCMDTKTGKQKTDSPESTRCNQSSCILSPSRRNGRSLRHHRMCHRRAPRGRPRVPGSGLSPGHGHRARGPRPAVSELNSRSTSSIVATASDFSGSISSLRACIAVELKSVERLDFVHKAQLLSYLRAAKLRRGPAVQLQRYTAD